MKRDGGNKRKKDWSDKEKMTIKRSEKRKEKERKRRIRNRQMEEDEDGNK